MIGNDLVVVNTDIVKSRMIMVRDNPALLDRDVAELYGVQTREINQAVRNNPTRFPEGYVIELSKEELTDLRSKFLTANVSSKSRVLPKVFTERGLYMLATILKRGASGSHITCNCGNIRTSPRDGSKHGGLAGFKGR